MTADPPDDATNDDIVDGARPDADALTVSPPFGTEVPDPEPAPAIVFGTPADDAGSHPGNNRAPEHGSFPDEPSIPGTDTADTEAAPPAATYRIAAWATGAGGLLHARFVRPVDQRYRTVARVGAWVLAVAVVLWILVFARLLVDRHNRFGTYAFDLGVYDQSVWLLSRFKDPFITVRGLNQWGFHANFMLYIFVPFYWLGAGPNLLNIAFALSLGLGAYPVYRIGRHYFANPVYGVVFALLYLVNPTLQFMTWETFHPDGMAILPMLFAWLFFLERRWRLFAVACVVAVLWKEDVALATAALGLFMVLFAKGHRLKGVATIVLSALYFQFINNVFLGHFTGDGAFYNDWFGELGSSPTEIAGNMIRHPDMVFSKFREPSASEYAWKLLTPFGWLPVLSIGAAFIAIPQLLVNVLANQTFFRDYRYHYASIILVGLTIASQNTVRLVGRLGNGRRWLCMGILVVCGVRTAQLWGVGPLTENYDAGFWPKQAGVADDARREALEMVPDDASLSAIYYLLVHSTQRVGAYDYPGPFIPRNWGLAGENVHDPATVDYVLVERNLLGDTTEFFDSLTARGGQFEVVFDRDDVVLAERVRAPGRGEVLPGTPEAMTQALPSTTSAEG